jgi:hypothetical protein
MGGIVTAWMKLAGKMITEGFSTKAFQRISCGSVGQQRGRRFATAAGKRQAVVRTGLPEFHDNPLEGGTTPVVSPSLLGKRDFQALIAGLRQHLLDNVAGNIR